MTAWAIVDGDTGGALERARAIARGLDERANRAVPGSSSQRAMRLGARVARREAFRMLIEHSCGPGAFRELGFEATRTPGEPGSRWTPTPDARPVTCTCRNRRPIGELAREAGIGLDLQEARTAGFTSCGAASGCVND